MVYCILNAIHEKEVKVKVEKKKIEPRDDTEKPIIVQKLTLEMILANLDLTQISHSFMILLSKKYNEENAPPEFRLEKSI